MFLHGTTDVVKSESEHIEHLLSSLHMSPDSQSWHMHTWEILRCCHIRYHPQKSPESLFPKGWWGLRPPLYLSPLLTFHHRANRQKKLLHSSVDFICICKHLLLRFPHTSPACPSAPRATRDLTRAHGGSVNRAGANRTLPRPHRVPFRCPTQLRAATQTAFSVTDGGCRGGLTVLQQPRRLSFDGRDKLRPNSWFTCETGWYL